MCHLITPWLLAFLHEVAAFPPSKLYVSKAPEFRTACVPLRMCHLVTSLLLAFLYEVAAFPPNKLYVSKAREFRTAWYFFSDGTIATFTITPESRFPFPIYSCGPIPWKVDHCGILLNLDTSDENFKAFAKKFDLKVEDWENIPYNPFDDTFTIPYHGEQIDLRPSTEPFPP
ncbi:hypothetical protein FOZ61_010398 [Perkinsus olseni]|uniref:Uncharacterized protein n=2 Tax=Perkinsus olseni TaxID=32597 RepID=A0A7J6M300_PEROL|nr:hypothetical protein FOZ61_010398 [Perkinsus olseni]